MTNDKPVAEETEYKDELTLVEMLNDEPVKNEYDMFEMLNDISKHKSGYMKTPLYSDYTKEPFDYYEFSKKYSIGLVSKAFGNHTDALFRLDLLNKKGHDATYHHDMLHLMLPSRTRFGKWEKEVPNKDIAIIAKYYDVRLEVATAYHRNMKPAKLKEIKLYLEDKDNEEFRKANMHT